jgi:hypothetical protein
VDKRAVECYEALERREQPEVDEAFIASWKPAPAWEIMAKGIFSL